MKREWKRHLALAAMILALAVTFGCFCGEVEAERDMALAELEACQDELKDTKAALEACEGNGGNGNGGGPPGPEVIVEPGPTGNIKWTIAQVALTTAHFVAPDGYKLNDVFYGNYVTTFSSKLEYLTPTGPEVGNVRVNQLDLVFTNGKTLRGYRVGSSSSEGSFAWWLEDASGWHELEAKNYGSSDAARRKLRSDLKGPLASIKVTFKNPRTHKDSTVTLFNKIDSVKIVNEE